eukprot:2155139-Rhodomonas_salina.1
MRVRAADGAVLGSVVLAFVGWLFAVLVGALGELAVDDALDARVRERRGQCEDTWGLEGPFSFCVGLWAVLSMAGGREPAGGAVFWHAAVFCRCA